MRRQYVVPAMFLAAALALSGCNSAGQRPPPETPIVSTTAPEVNDEETNPPAVEALPEQEAEPNYIDHVVQETIAKFTQPGMSEYEKAKAAFDYMIEATNLADPVGLDLWRIRGTHDGRPSFVENRSLSVLLYGIGMCEDYAAALTMLLRGMGMEAEYVPGLTYAANGSGLVDHAWTIAKIDGVWYHLDSQLEDNISRRDTIRYKYFMRGDATLSVSHRWGQNLINSGLLTAEQNAEIARDFIFEACPQDYPTPSPHAFTSAAMPDEQAIKDEIEAEFRQYARVHGSLEPLELNLIPPVFGLEGFGPPE